MVRLAGIEPTTPWFVAKYSIQLSYSRIWRRGWDSKRISVTRRIHRLYPSFQLRKKILGIHPTKENGCFLDITCKTLICQNISGNFHCRKCSPSQNNRGHHHAEQPSSNSFRNPDICSVARACILSSNGRNGSNCQIGTSTVRHVLFPRPICLNFHARLTRWRCGEPNGSRRLIYATTPSDSINALELSGQ